MSNTYTEIKRGEDVYGIRWAVGTDEGALVVMIGGSVGTLDGDQRDRFAEAVARAVMPGQRVNHGPACGCTPCLAEPSYAARRAVAETCACGRQIEPCDCGGTVCPGWGHTARNATRHWCGRRKEDGQPRPAEAHQAVSGG